MSESLLSFTIIFAELGGVLLLVVIGWVVMYLFNAKKEGKTTRDLIHQIKSAIPTHRNKLIEFFKDKLEQNKIDFNIETLIKDERKIYDRLIKVSITKDTSLLKLTVEDINSLIEDYVRLLSLKATADANVDSSSATHEFQLRKENEALRLEVASLETRLSTATETIENMMGEFSSMYEGGKKEGEQRVKNEMYKLKQSLDKEEADVKSKLKNLKKEGE